MGSRWPGGRSASEERVRRVREIPVESVVHLGGICGTGMASVGALLKQLDYRVQGSDKAFYPPMGDLVRSIAERIFEGYRAENLSPPPSFVVIGNNLRRDNPEVEFVLKAGIPYASMPEVFAALLIGTREYCRNSIVIAGTHGKTTTAAGTAFILERGGLRPGYFIGGVPHDLPGPVRSISVDLLPERRAVVLEGDEYDSAFFAKWPKFHSYRPDLLVVTSLEFDHADIYGSVEEIEDEFTELVASVPGDGLVLVCDRSDRLRSLAMRWKSSAAAPIAFYGTDPNSTYRLTKREMTAQGQLVSFSLAAIELTAMLRLSGEHNALNLLAAAASGERLGVREEDLAGAVESFRGVMRRQQLLAEACGITLLEDFAHHPTAIAVTLSGLKEVYPRRRLIAVYEPRSNTARQDFYQESYPASFAAADVVFILEVGETESYSATGRGFKPLDVSRIVRELRAAGKEAMFFPSVEELETHLIRFWSAGDVIVGMSNGDFGGLLPRLREALCGLGH